MARKCAHESTLVALVTCTKVADLLPVGVEPKLTCHRARRRVSA